MSLYSGECLLQLAQRCMKHQRQMEQIHSLVITNGHLVYHPNASSPHQKWMPTLLYNALIKAQSHHIQTQHKTLLLFTHMLENQAPPNSYTFPPLLKSYPPITLGTALHSQALKRGLLSDPFILTSLLALYARNNHLAHARRVFEEVPLFCIVSCNAMLNAFSTNGNMEAAMSLFESMSHRDVVSWTTLVNGFALNGNFGAAIRFFGQMMMMTHEDCLVKPNEATYVSVLSSCANLDGEAALDCGKQVHGYIVANEVNLGVFLGTSLINFYGKMGCLNYAVNVFNLMVSRAVCTWNAMISSLASNGREKEALDMFEKMKLQGLRPNSITFVAVLTACARGSFVREGLELFRSMSHEFQVVPIMKHYGCVIDLLGRAGYVQEAADIIRNMPFQPDASVLGAFLGACRIHGAIELGEEIGKKELKLQTQHCGQYVILSSMNAEKERWDHAADLRKEMMEAGIQKIPAYSMVHLR
ncbi:putative pentatricopeptide repeat-containing protein At1g10330 [Gastrolobium bilobum]|uniref:putative pentatricopeptide repeat-containing protein At1g10330 n=1 Tax=Gastrolobium bilobum TaxID=150636 RepID=UPI002AAFF94D|nr:putative pentatricopeptide repeat-containing protein At1g10330 [Gastrolobium bilobum]